MKSYDVNLGGKDGGMPTSLFDPRWNEPEVAARVAFTIYCRVPFDGEVELLDDRVVSAPANLVDARTFSFAHVHERNGIKVKAGSFGELHRRYAAASHTANFHAQAVAFAVDSLGHFLLTAIVGRFDGPWGNHATLAATFFAGQERIGAATWSKAMDPAGDHRVVVAGTDERIAAKFDAIDHADIAFVARTGVENAVETKPKLSKAKQKALELKAKR
jgi:hypothetical protein